jgi:gliding motility associated protien GldN
MKKILFSIFTLALFGIPANAQINPNHFYEHTNKNTEKEPMAYPTIRENDVIWETVIWREIDMKEKFNQFMYFPTGDRGTQGRVSLVSLLYNAAKDGAFEVYDNDDMLEALDWEAALRKVASQETKPIETGELDEDDNPITKDSVFFSDDFDASTAKKIRLKEYWYIDKHDTRQKVRIVGLAFVFDKTTYQAGKETPVPNCESFWIPMNDLRVRKVLVNADAFDENNDVIENSYDNVFVQRYFDSYITRESNVYNRPIAGKDGYLTGEDAILESQRIEDKIFEIESDMWEY